ncbi:MAG: ABC transporter ATP-binding protein [Bacteroidia bacterium]|nr:ABC transporter ATP-binding protein [Bacteroidia bacterium]
MDTGKKIIEIHNLNIGYPSKTIFSGINLSAYQGELIALIGINGAGKSTLLRTLARLQKESSGKVTIEGNNIHQYSIKTFAQRVSFVSTEPVYVSNLNVKELVALGRFPHTNWLGKLDEKDSAAVERAIHKTNIENLAEKNINQISDGERQRAMIARTIAQDTDIIILDEPTAFLDLPNRYETVSLLKALSKNENKTVIFSTHDLNIAIRQADKIWLIQKDKIIEGAPEDLVLNNCFTHIFESSKISFDIEKGDFTIPASMNRSVKLTGDGAEYLWTVKALERLGYLVSDSNNENITVRITRENNRLNWVIEKENCKFAVNSIYELSAILGRR